jgi:hypothetical protein
VDFVIVLIHWGIEYRREASKDQKKLAADMFEWGADIILGSSPACGGTFRNPGSERRNEVCDLWYGELPFQPDWWRQPSERSNDFTEDSMMVNLALQKDMETGKASLSRKAYSNMGVPLSRGQGLQITVYPIPSVEDSFFEGWTPSWPISCALPTTEPWVW